MRRLKSHPSSKLRAQKIALLLGGTLGKTEINVFLSTLSLFCLLTGSDNAARNFGFVANQIRLLVAAGHSVQQSKCLALLGIAWWALGCKGSTRLRGPDGAIGARSGPDSAIGA